MSSPSLLAQRAHRYDGAENRRRVLDAALEIFSELGYAAASTRAIAAQAGLEQGHLAYYFPNKLALWQAVIEAFAHEAEHRLREQLALAPKCDAPTLARAILPPFLRSFAENPRLTRLMLQEFSVTSERSAWLTKNFARPVWALLMPVFEDLRAAGHLAGAAPEIAYFSLIGAALITFGNGMLIEELSGRSPNTSQWIDGAVAHMLAPILAAGPG